MASAAQAAAAPVLRPLARLLGLASEGATLAAAIGLVLVALAQPAMREIGPTWLRRLALSVTFLDRDGREIGHRGIRHEHRLALDELPETFIQAVLATEDRRFFSHWGIDPVGLGRALMANAQADGVVQGGSTITQQLAKNVFLSGERTLERKIKEAFLALWLESQLSKREILRLYLDRAYLGAGAFGVEAAAEVYFGKSIREVTLPEAAMLAGLFKAPSRYAPHRGGAGAAARAADVLDRMFAEGYITRAERDWAKLHPATAAPREPAWAPDYYLDFAFRQVQRLAASGAFGEETVLRVRTPLDPELQRTADRVIGSALRRDGTRLNVGQAAMLVMRPDGAVMTMVGGRDYEESQFNRVTEALRQPGSAFKPFVYAAALAYTALRPESPVSDTEICIGRWCPSNYGRGFSGTMPLAAALARSINTVAVRLSVEIGRAAGEMTTGSQARFGRARIIALARSLGITTPLADVPSLPLGASEVTLLDMTRSYAAFASEGYRVEPWAVESVRGAGGRPLFERGEAAGPKVLGPGLVQDMNRMLARVVEAGTARGAAVPSFATAGKTGTTSAYRDAWFVGFTGRLAAGIWVGNDDSSPTRQVTGGSLPATLWREVMTFAHRDLTPVPLPGLGGTVLATAAEPARPAGFGEAVPAATGGFQVLSGGRATAGFR